MLAVVGLITVVVLVAAGVGALTPPRGWPGGAARGPRSPARAGRVLAVRLRPLSGASPAGGGRSPCSRSSSRRPGDGRRPGAVRPRPGGGSASPAAAAGPGTGRIAGIPTDAVPRPRRRRAAAPRPRRSGRRRRPAARHGRGAHARLDGRRGAAAHPHHRPGHLLVAQPRRVLGEGETSGNRQWVREVRVDCDGDALLVLVDQEGAACHTGDRSCFHRRAPRGRGGRR